MSSLSNLAIYFPVAFANPKFAAYATCLFLSQVIHFILSSLKLSIISCVLSVDASFTTINSKSLYDCFKTLNIDSFICFSPLYTGITILILAIFYSHKCFIRKTPRSCSSDFTVKLAFSSNPISFSHSSSISTLI